MRRTTLILSMLAAASLCAACSDRTTPSAPVSIDVPLSSVATLPSPTVLTAALAALPIITEHPMAGYDRDLFGQPWRDTDHTGCDQRSDAMARDAQTVTRNPRRHCQITAILMIDPYTSEQLTSTAQIQIDHVVPLAAAWRAGADGWNAELRERFATDMDNLLPTRSGVNQAKSDQTPDTWRPPDSAANCHYATIYITICTRYHLGITAPAHDALAELAGTCR